MLDVPGKQPWESSKYLSLDTIPSFYAIFLQPNMDSGNYTGSVNITVHTTAAKRYLWLHNNDVNLTNTAVLALPSMKTVAFKSVLVYYPNNFIVIEFENDLPTGDYQLQFQYYGSIRNKDVLLEFFYSYEDINNITR